MSKVSKQEISTYQFIYNIPDRIAFDLTLSVHDLRVYMIVRSFIDTTGDVYASNDYIAKRLNVDRSTVIRSINRLCKKKYIFREDINGNRHLGIVTNSVRNEVMEKREDGVAHVPPPRRTAATPPSHTCHPIRSKIITSNKINTTTTKEKTKSSGSSSSDFIINEKSDSKLLQLRDKYLADDVFDRNDREFLKQCSHHLDNGDKTRYNFSRRMKGLESIIKAGFFETPAGYNERKVVKSRFTPEEVALMQTYLHVQRYSAVGAKLEDFIPNKDEVKKAIKLLAKAEKLQNPV
jgi:predicted transcriptional regulator